MAMTLEQLEKEALGLKRSEKVELLRFLVEDIDEVGDENLDEYWVEVAERRLATHRSGRTGARPAKEVFAEAHQRLKS